MDLDASLARETDIAKLKELGRQLLKDNQVDKALKVYARVLQLNAEDLDALLVLGDAYLIRGEKKPAVLLYQEALRLLPWRKDIERRLGLASGHENVDVPTEPRSEDIARLVRRILGDQVQISENEVASAGELLNAILRADSPASYVSSHLEDIDRLLPGLIELNIRQARLDGRADLAESLENLLENMVLQLDAATPGMGTRSFKPLNILVIGPTTQDSPFRKMVIEESLKVNGHFVYNEQIQPEQAALEYDLVIGTNPHGDPATMKKLAIHAASSVPVIMDLSHDFARLPESHPDYARFAISQHENLRSFNAVTQLVNRVTVANLSQVEKFNQMGIPARYIPDGWTQTNPLWEKPAAGRSSVNLGLFVQRGQLEDIQPARRAIVRMLREFLETRLVVYGDPEAYKLFDTIPESRKLFLPPVDAEDYPFLLSHVDIMLAPLPGNALNNHKSDRLLMEAGIRNIPWVASPLPCVLEWGSGGLVAGDAEQWYNHIHQLVTNRQQRMALGRAGYEKALQREVRYLSKLWSEVVQETLAVARSDGAG